MPKLIYVVEDDEFIRQDLGELLETENYDVKVFRNGRDAWEALAITDRYPNLMVIDLMMPVMNGYELSEKLSNDEKLSVIPIIVLSADQRIKDALVNKSVREVIPKPIDIDYFLTMVQRLSAE